VVVGGVDASLGAEVCVASSAVMGATFFAASGTTAAGALGMADVPVWQPLMLQVSLLWLSLPQLGSMPSLVEWQL
jgi:hypothetical protein